MDWHFEHWHLKWQTWGSNNDNARQEAQNPWLCWNMLKRKKHRRVHNDFEIYFPGSTEDTRHGVGIVLDPIFAEYVEKWTMQIIESLLYTRIEEI